MQNEKVKIAILGFGTVGLGVYRVISENVDQLLHREKIEYSVKRILEKDLTSGVNLDKAPKELFTTDINEIINDKEISTVCECIGGVEPARTFILKVLESGKNVVTSNKEVVAKHWPEFQAAAEKSGAGFYIEATAGGGMPIIRTLIDSMQANNIDLIMGIVNGTTNYILTKMTQEGADYAKTLAQAQALGYAEANPAADVEGWDCVYKLSILSSIAFHARVSIDEIYREGITGVTVEDIKIAKDLGYVIKLLAIGKKFKGMNGELQVRVHPTMIPMTHPLATVNGVFNGVFLHGHAVDDIMLYGRGAGEQPTASAMVSDLIYASHTTNHKYMTFVNTYDAAKTHIIQNDWISAYCIRMNVKDEAGVLAKVASIFANHGISIKNALQRSIDKDSHSATIIFITHQAKEASLQAAVTEIKALPVVSEIQSVMRVED